MTTAGLEIISISGSRRKMRVFIIDVPGSRMHIGPWNEAWVVASIMHVAMDYFKRRGCPVIGDKL